MSNTSKPYSVRCWDEFWQNWCMIPETFKTREEAIARAIELSDCYDCGENGTEEMQVHVDCGMNTSQMVGYVMLDENDEWVFEEDFC